MKRYRILPLIPFIVALSAVSQVECKPHSREKRTILQMCALITHYTGRSCLDFNGYGCFCGLGNRGNKPLDHIDTCCRKHDNCYGEVSCFWFYPQWVGYNVNCNEGTDEEQRSCQCTDSYETSPCSYSTCRCDLMLAQCLQNATYHDYYQSYNRQLCNHVPAGVSVNDDRFDDVH